MTAISRRRQATTYGLFTALALTGCAADLAAPDEPAVDQVESAVTTRNTTTWMMKQPILTGYIPYIGSFGPIHGGARITTVNFPTQYPAFHLLKPGHGNADCFTSGAYIRVSGDMTSDQMIAYFGSAQPQISGNALLGFFGCSEQSGQTVFDALPVNIRWDDLTPEPPHDPPPPPTPPSPPSNPHPNECRSAPARPGAHVRVDVAASWSNGNHYDDAIYASSGTEFSDYNDWVSSANVAKKDRVSGDFNGDGLSDLAAMSTYGNQNLIWVRLSTGSSFNVAIWEWTGGLAHASNTQWLPGDFDGDGRTDLAELWKDGDSLTITMHRSTGSSFATPVLWAYRDGGWGDTIKWTTGYFDADNRADILGIWNQGGENTLTVRRSTGSSFTHEHWGIQMGGWMDSTEWLAGDYNGDGLTDVAALWNNGGDLNVAVFPSSGHSFPGWSQWAERQGGWFPGIKWSAGDYDGDGLTDLLAVWNGGGHNILTVRRSTGGGFNHEHWRISQGGWSDDNAWCSGKFR
jgi:hypothetical protein